MWWWFPFVWAHIVAPQSGFFGMDGATWAQLWSGIVGAVLGSAAAAVVAGYVLKATLAEQRRLAGDAQVSQSKLAHRQLEEQQKALNLQLGEQRTALNLQLREQRGEASKARGIEAVAALVAEIDQVVWDAQKSRVHTFDELTDLRLRLTAICSRWSLDIENEDMRKELVLWPSLIFTLARSVSDGTGNSRANWMTLLVASTALRTVSMAWYRNDSSAQQELADKLRKDRIKYDPLHGGGSEQYDRTVAAMRAEAGGGEVSLTE
ncbi:hypothetical protein [Pseudarthrobacter sp. fls2-241-R2A-127]|uniref:hypothetical protein n=1 Tax=Pseudarthrobacter sp. fls2-241-R2A-127 TaxID=3040303 RepID=UPI0025548E36|nr:hypothetical protein [Pseudarthrobacter sp. fls2-241-R2A-127]